MIAAGHWGCHYDCERGLGSRLRARVHPEVCVLTLLQVCPMAWLLVS